MLGDRGNIVPSTELQHRRYRCWRAYRRSRKLLLSCQQREERLHPEGGHRPYTVEPPFSALALEAIKHYSQALTGQQPACPNLQGRIHPVVVGCAEAISGVVGSIATLAKFHSKSDVTYGLALCVPLSVVIFEGIWRCIKSDGTTEKARLEEEV